MHAPDIYQQEHIPHTEIPVSSVDDMCRLWASHIHLLLKGVDDPAYAAVLKTMQGVDNPKVFYVDYANQCLEDWWSLLRMRGQSKEALLSAAQQVAKIYIDWPDFFGESTLEHDCPVTYQMMVEMTARFGAETISRLSATKKRFRV